MVTVRTTIAGVALIAAVTGDVTGVWMAMTGRAAAGGVPSAGAYGLSASAAAGHVQITAPGRADQFNPLGSRRRKKSG